MSQKSRVVLLVGPKGAGKSTLCRRLEGELGGRFVPVEPIYLRILQSHPDADPAAAEATGFGAVLDEVNRVAERHRVVCIESTGTAGYFPTFLRQLRARHYVSLVRVLAPAETCLARVRARDAADHIPVSDERVRQVNRLAEHVRLAWDVEVENGGDRSVTEVANEIARALERSRAAGLST